MSMPSAPRISLSAQESEVFRLLVECANWIDDNPQEVDALRQKDAQGNWVGNTRGAEKVQLRVAGGYVRDKLLNLDSDDIDVSISPDPITGLKFATLLEKWFTTVIGRPELMGKLTKIEAKPDQSKHLETATAKVCQSDLDFVQQRGMEVYTDASRIPTASFGTPLEDANRRDLTINALFYNLHTQEVEDHTGRGLQDLGLVPGHEPMIRTPLTPRETFMDDPLRVLRTLRFAARYKFRLDPELELAIGLEEIRAALRDPNKISRERVGTEVDKMLLGDDPLYAMELFDRLNLHSIIFLSTVPSFHRSPSAPPSSPPTPSPPPPNPHLSLLASEILADLLALPCRRPSTLRSQLHPLLTLSRSSSSRASSSPSPTPDQSSPSSSPPAQTPTTISRADTRRLFISAGLLPLDDLYTLKKGKEVWLGSHVVMLGIKGTGMDDKWVESVRKASRLLADAVRRFGTTDEARSDEQRRAERADLGMLLKDPSVSCPDGSWHGTWNVTLFWSLVVELVNVAGDATASSALIAHYNRFTSLIVSLSLESASTDPPLLNGDEILSALPAAVGPAMREMKDAVFRWQFAHPGEGQEACRAWLQGEEAAAVLRDAVEKANKGRPEGQGLKKKKAGKGVIVSSS
ncbi:hypothetical protein RQP46_008281 [Phenoliferia psychrophenolica]